MQDPKDNQEVASPDTGAAGNGAENAARADDPSTGAVPSLEEALRQAELRAQEHHDAWLRARAEADNIRKRAQTEVENARKFGVENFAEALLPVKDSLDAALAAENNTVEALRSGVELTVKQLVAAFARHNVCEIDPVGQKFDPHRHQAMSMIESDEAPNTVVQVFQKGYLLHDRVIRPALVAVAKSREG